MTETMPSTGGRSAHHYAWLSIAAAIATISLKLGAWWVTGSVGLLSDALESVVNLAGAGFALWMLLIASTPPDDKHPWGHSKAEYFSSGFEGTLIFIASLAIAATAIPRLLNPQPIGSLDIGLALSVLSTLINFATAQTLFRAARRLHSVALEADARHLMTDVWTTVGVLAGIGMVALTGWHWLDPVIALLVAGHILKEGAHLMQGAVGGLMDEAMDPQEQALAVSILDGFGTRGAQWQNLRTRRAGRERFLHLDLLVPPDWTVDHAHHLADEVEAAIMAAIPGAHVTTHVEPLHLKAGH
ncbi:cation diffusion facilitator family transporter [Niveibacterium sp. 24ML]|uniref:cation diffusion facilitator family transporter n=1 Tax=Niveibacterium sp. 24ML TaxID=2985512 RepID=UPI00226FA90B|nr:cation diffusion facilitator family transporter [Niveibacterium sp. 24ML]MCX9156141.1 cation diffusion facilitator family transporter [Niveibacterium sp. 24ML]